MTAAHLNNVDECRLRSENFMQRHEILIDRVLLQTSTCRR